MPNMLAHLGVGSAVTRLFDRTADSKWIYLGCMIPDLPWIAQRITRATGLSVDVIDLRLYTTSQATLFGCILLSSALAVISAAPRRVFLILAGNSLVHLLLDACQTKWGRGGVHLLAPVSWTPLNFELFWPESILTCALTLFGLVYCVVEMIKGESGPIGLAFGPRRMALFLLLLASYLVFPMATLSGAFAADCHFAKTLSEVDQRTARPLELDRVRFRTESSGTVVRTYGREDLRADFSPSRPRGKVSLRAEFTDSDRITVLEFHEHWPGFRVATSLIGIGIVVYAWLAFLFRKRSQSGV